MRVLLYVLPLLILATMACRKDQADPICNGVTMSGERARFVGKWRWYSTTVEEWFDIGPSNWYYYTPDNQNIEYTVEITPDGKFQMYMNGSLVKENIIHDIKYENYMGESTKGMSFGTNCSSTQYNMSMFAANVTEDSMFILEYPYDFDDEENHLRSYSNYFVKM